jgi:two-component system cell cycle sensor histidine kinase/response regulator CckA
MSQEPENEKSTQNAAAPGKEAGAQDLTPDDNLERRVAERTLDLKEVILKLEQEIKERKRVEAQLRESENKFRNIVDASPMGIHMYRCSEDSGLIFTGANPAADRILNIDNRQFIGQTIEQAFPALTYAGIPEFYRRVCTEGVPWHAEQLAYEDGRIKGWFEVHAFQTKPGEMAVMFLDISPRKSDEETLKKEKEKFRVLTEMSPLGVALIGNDGSYRYINPKFEELFGYTLSDIPSGREWFQKAFPDAGYRKKVVDTWIRDLKNADLGEVRPRTYTVRCLDGTDKIVHFRPVTMDEGNQIIIYEDITERKQLEAHLQQSQKMEAIGTLAGGIAHDFNNILAAILGYGELLAFDMPKGTPAWQNLQAVLKSSHRAKDLVGQILAFSRQNELNLMPVQISSIVKEALQMLRASLPATIEIHRHIESTDAIVNANPTQIHQVLMNLCTNAAHAMRAKGGEMGVSLRRVQLNLQNNVNHPDLSPGVYLELSVSDTGHGIPAKQMNRIFDPYFTTKEAGDGTGLGLAVVRGIVRAHGGAVTVESTPEKGSIFHVFLPEMYNEITAKTETNEPLRTGKETILFVDDEQALVTMSKQMLELLGYKAVTRTSSVEAFELFQHDPHRFDLVITDMTMPNMTGEKLAQKVLEVRPDIPVILCTGYSEQITEQLARELGIRAFVMKPLVMRDIANTIREVLDKT